MGRVREAGQIRVNRALGVFGQCCQALTLLHYANIWKFCGLNALKGLFFSEKRVKMTLKGYGQGPGATAGGVPRGEKGVPEVVYDQNFVFLQNIWPVA